MDEPWTPAAWCAAVLAAVPAPTTPGNVDKLLHWLPAENGAAWWTRCDPLNVSATTTDPGFSFPTLAAAAAATAQEIEQNPDYAAILQNLRWTGTLDSFSSAVVASPWSADHYGGTPLYITRTDPTELDPIAPPSCGTMTVPTSEEADMITSFEASTQRHVFLTTRTGKTVTHWWQSIDPRAVTTKWHSEILPAAS